MLFSTNIFIYVFMPICIGVYYISKKIFRDNRVLSNLILLLFSMLFYIYGSGKRTIILVISILFNYIFALCIDAYKEEKLKRKIVFYFAITFNICFLIYFKYFNFICENIRELLELIRGGWIQL